MAGKYHQFQRVSERNDIFEVYENDDSKNLTRSKLLYLKCHGILSRFYLTQETGERGMYMILEEITCLAKASF